jgi:hypothetical protein
MGNRVKFVAILNFVSLLALFILSSCSNTHIVNLENRTDPTPSVLPATPSQTETNQITPSRSPTSPTQVKTKAATHQDLDLSCKKPSEDYTRIEINGNLLNQRTLEMLTTAKLIYGGVIDIIGDAITQGSYTSATEASFGTHAGGGAVDLSVMAPGTYTILYEDIPPLITALRSAGFAAWYRDLDALYDGSPAHIHAIAIGDRELSLAAREQLAGPFGYFWGYNGLPQENNRPIRDPHGGPIVCEWMLEKGYPNKTATPSPGEKIP